MEISTNTYTSVPTCENCGRDKQATYICDVCCDKLNAMHRDLLAERNRLAAENIELQKDRDNWQRRCRNLVEAMAHHGYRPESLARIAEGRDNG